MEPFASNLRRRAKELGISNAEAARRSGLSERRYGNYISGRREPDLGTLIRIAVALETSPDHLLSFGESPPSTDEAILAQRVASAARALRAAELKIIAVMVEALASKAS